MAKVLIEVVKDRQGVQYAEFRVDPRHDDCVRIGERICIFEMEIEGAQRHDVQVELAMLRTVAKAFAAVVAGGLMDDQERAVEMAVPGFKVNKGWRM